MNLFTAVALVEKTVSYSALFDIGSYSYLTVFSNDPEAAYQSQMSQLKLPTGKHFVRLKKQDPVLCKMHMSNIIEFTYTAFV